MTNTWELLATNIENVLSTVTPTHNITCNRKEKKKRDQTVSLGLFFKFEVVFNRVWWDVGLLEWWNRGWKDDLGQGKIAFGSPLRHFGSLWLSHVNNYISRLWLGEEEPFLNEKSGSGPQCIYLNPFSFYQYLTVLMLHLYYSRNRIMR